MYDDDDLNAPLATEALQPRDEAGRWAVNADSEPAPVPAPEAAPEPEPAPEPAPEPEPEPAPEPEPEPAPEPEPEPDDKAEKLAKQKVPYSRFKEAVEKERAKREAAERELEAVRQQLQDQPSVDITEEELNQLGDLLIEGKTADYAKGMKGVLEKMFQKGIEAATVKAEATRRIETAEDRIARERQEAAARWQSEYPQFDPDSSDFDEDLLMEAVTLRDAYESRGMSPAAAIERAVLRLVGGPKPVQEAAVAPAPKPRPSTVTQKMAAANAQPPLPTGNGEVDKPVSLLSRIQNMTDEEFDQLSEADLEKLRRGIKL